MATKLQLLITGAAFGLAAGLYALPNPNQHCSLRKVTVEPGKVNTSLGGDVCQDITQEVYGDQFDAGSFSGDIAAFVYESNAKDAIQYDELERMAANLGLKADIHNPDASFKAMKQFLRDVGYDMK